MRSRGQRVRPADEWLKLDAPARLRAELASRAEDVQALLAQTTLQARQMLRKLLDREKFTVTPIQEGERIGFSGKVSLERLLVARRRPYRSTHRHTIPD